MLKGAEKMSEKPLILVVGDTINTDKPCVVCGEANKGTVKMLVTYIGNGADEVYKMVSEQGYLYRYNDEIRAEERNKVLDEVYKIITDQMIKHGTDLDFNLETQELILQMRGEQK